MRAEVQRFLLSYIAEEWRTLPQLSPAPWGAWITLYPAVEDCSDNPFSRWPVPVSAWFLDRRGVSRRSVWEYRRYVVSQLEKPWCTRPFGEPNPRHGCFFEIGLAAFAQRPADDEVYVETLWGGLYGEGRLVEVDSGGVRRKRRIWIA